MSIRVEEDLSSARGGQARIWIDRPLVEKDAAFSIRRLHGEPDILGRNGWQSTPVTLKPMSVETKGNETCLIVGPEVCHAIAADIQVEIAIPAAGLKEEIFWPYVTPASGGKTAVLDTGKRPSPESAARPSEPAPAVSKVPPTDEAERTGGDPPDPQPQPQRRRRWILPAAALGVLGLLIVGAVTYFLFAQDGDVAEQVVEATSEPDPQAPPAEEAEAPAEGQREQSPVEEPVSLSYEQQLQACVAQDCPPDRFFELGVQLFESGNHDLGFRAIDRAAGDGHGPALEQIARWYDPRYFTPESGLSRADPLLASSYYERAEEAGVGNAAESIEGMCSHLAEGDEGRLAQAPPCLR